MPHCRTSHNQNATHDERGPPCFLNVPDGHRARATNYAPGAAVRSAIPRDDCMLAQEEMTVTSTGELVPAINTDHSTALQIEQWLHAVKDAVQHMTTIEELNQAEAMLMAVVRRLRQLDADAAEAERVRILAFRRIGDLLGPAKPNGGVVNTYGRAGKPDVIGFEDVNPITPKPQAEKHRDWQARKVAENWDKVEPLIADMKKPSINAVMREIKRMESKLTEVPDGGAAIITHSRWEDWLPNQPACDMLFTDPPYATDVDDIESFAAHWLPFALGKVKRTGRAYVCIGAYPDELAAYLTIPPPPSLVLSQVLVWTYRNTLGPTPKHDYKLNWQAILYYRGVDAAPLDSPEMVEQFSVQDINAPDGRQGDRWHAWQKPDKLAERFIRHSTQPGDIILDPFAGTGTHLLAAARLGRRGYGCEMSADTFGIALDRGCINAG